jgi:hypothetical protein
MPNLEAEAQVAHDLHDALGVKWGDDPYAEINRLKALSTLAHEQAGALSGRRMPTMVRGV